MTLPADEILPCRDCGKPIRLVAIEPFPLYGHTVNPTYRHHPAVPPRVRLSRSVTASPVGHTGDGSRSERPDTDREDVPASGRSPDRPSRKRGVRARTAVAVAPALRESGRPVSPRYAVRSPR